MSVSDCFVYAVFNEKTWYLWENLLLRDFFCKKYIFFGGFRVYRILRWQAHVPSDYCE